MNTYHALWLSVLLPSFIFISSGCDNPNHQGRRSRSGVAVRQVDSAKSLKDITLTDQERAKNQQKLNRLLDTAKSKQDTEPASTATNEDNPIPEPTDNSANGSGVTPSDLEAVESPAVEGWPVFRGNAHSTGIAKGELPEKLEVVWKHEVPQGAFEGSACIVPLPGKPETKVAYIGDLDGQFFAFDLATGEEIWTTKLTEIGFKTGAAYRDGRLFIGDMDGFFYCLDAKTGNREWKFTTNGEINSSANFYHNLVIFGSQDAFLYALDAKSGEKKWDLETADQVRCGITIAGNKAFVAGCDGGLHLINLDTAKEESSVDIASPTGVTPAVLGNMVYAGSEQSGFLAINWKTSKLEWNFDTDGAPVRSSASVTKDRVVFAAQNRTVFCVDPINGKQLWAQTLKSKVETSPLVIGNRVFIGSNSGQFCELNLIDGSIVWQKQLEGGILGSPAIAYGKLVIATDRGLVYCFGKK